MSEILYYICIFPLEQVLEFFLMRLSKISLSYGMGIIYLSLLVNLFLLKISLYTDIKAKAEAALKAKLDSRIKAWKSVYKRAKLYAFTQTLYRQHNYHPIYALRSLGGFLMQIPFFIAMIHLVENAGYLQEVRFLWITDLSKPDSITLLGFSIHLLPILMTLFTLINVFYSSKELGARIQGSVIALLFLVLLYSMPSALVLYWTCNMVFALIKEVIKVRFGNSSLTQSLREYQKNASVTTDKVAPSHFFSQPTNLTQDTRIAESQKLNSRSSLRGSEASVAIHNNIGKATNTHFQINNTESKLDSKQMDCHADKSARNDELASMDCRNNNRQAYNSANTSANNGGTLTKLLNAIFTPHNALTPKDYKLYRNISILAILNICFMICVFSPYAVYSSDVSQFDVNQTYQTLGALFGVFLTSSLIIIYLTSFFYKTRLFVFGVYVVSILLIMGLANTFIFVGDYGAMDHFVLQKPEFNDKWRFLYAFLAIGLGVIIAWRFLRYLKSAFSIILLTLFTLSAFDMVKISQANEIYKPQEVVATDDEAPYEKELFSYSKIEKNIVVIVLDMFAGSHMPYILNQFPEFREKLDGFVLFDNAISTTNATMHSIATLIGGEYYSVYNMNARKDNLVDSITEAFGVIGDTFIKNGYDVGYFGAFYKSTQALLQYNQNIGLIKNANIYKNLLLQDNDTARLLFESASKNGMRTLRPMLGFGAFRFVTEIYLRGIIYNDGQWLGDSGMPNETKYAVNAAAMLYAFARIHESTADKPTFKYLHFEFTHVPYAVYFNNNQCLFTNKYDDLARKTAWDEYPHGKSMRYHFPGQQQFQHYDTEVCSLSYLSDLIEWLKSENIYDNTQIFIVSDHSKQDSLNVPEFVTSKGANPDALFLFKDFNSRGLLQQDSRLMTNYDSASIFCENLPNGCPNVPKNILKNYPQDRQIISSIPSHWIIDKHKPNEWLIDYYFKVQGNIYNESSWQDITESVKNGTFKIDGINH